jgi:hypothetical protein
VAMRNFEELMNSKTMSATTVGNLKTKGRPHSSKKPINNEKKSANKASQKTWRLSIARRQEAYYISKRST